MDTSKITTYSHPISNTWYMHLYAPTPLFGRLMAYCQDKVRDIQCTNEKNMTRYHYTQTRNVSTNIHPTLSVQLKGPGENTLGYYSQLTRLGLSNIAMFNNNCDGNRLGIMYSIAYAHFMLIHNSNSHERLYEE